MPAKPDDIDISDLWYDTMISGTSKYEPTDFIEYNVLKSWTSSESDCSESKDTSVGYWEKR